MYNLDDSDIDFEGDGFRDMFNEAKKRITSVISKGRRLDYGPKERGLLQLYGAYQIVQITICRAPIAKAIDTALDALSLSQWSSLKDKHSYDRFYHLYMLVKLSNSHMIRIEKNATINISNGFKIEEDAEFYEVDLNGLQITLNDFLKKALDKYGAKLYFLYSPFDNNCQKYILRLLECNGLLTEGSKEFIYQDINELIEELPWYTRMIGENVTKIAGIGNVLLHGEGFNNNNNNDKFIPFMQYTF